MKAESLKRPRNPYALTFACKEQNREHSLVGKTYPLSGSFFSNVPLDAILPRCASRAQEHTAPSNTTRRLCYDRMDPVRTQGKFRYIL